jgi:MFS family permease
MNEFPIASDDLIWGFFVSIYLLGGIIGGLAGGHLASFYGRRVTLIYNNAFFLIGGLSLYSAPHILILCTSRFILGLGAGVATSVVPLYINELSHIDRRGTFVPI